MTSSIVRAYVTASGSSPAVFTPIVSSMTKKRRTKKSSLEKEFSLSGASFTYTGTGYSRSGHALLDAAAPPRSWMYTSKNSVSPAVLIPNPRAASSASSTDNEQSL